MEKENKRHHGLDAYRAILMILGVVLHTAVIYGLKNIIDSIHTFRMPAFFLLSGYFGALLLCKYDFIKMIKNRVKRVLIPCFVLIFVFFPINTFIWSFLDSFNRGSIDPLNDSLQFTVKNPFLPTDTMHFWFLYFLIFIIFIVVFITFLMKHLSYSAPKFQNKLKTILEGPWSFMIFTGVSNFLWFILLRWGQIPTDTRWMPNLIIIFYYTFFYSLGWFIYNLEVDLSSFKKNAWIILFVGVLCSIYHSSFDHLFIDYDNEKGMILQWEKVCWFLIKVFLGSISLVCWVRGLLGVFLKYCSKDNKVWRYISDSSYWVFIIHITICPPAYLLLTNWDAPIIFKFIISTILVFFICLFTYDGFVRSTFIGKFLNGRSYPSFKKRTGLFMFFIFAGAVIFFFKNPPPVLERPSPWAQKKNPIELLPRKDVLYPFFKNKESLKGISFLRCAKVEEYLICPDGLIFEDAKKACVLQGGKITSFDSKEKYKDVMKWLPKILKRRIWLAVTDSKKEGVWLWPDKKPLAFDYWIANQPDNWGKGENCAEIHLWRETPRWNDISCDSKLAYICDLKANKKI